jgi:hypothetical protein
VNVVPLQAKVRSDIPLSSLQTKNSWSHGFGSFLGETIAKYEAMRLFGAAEESSPEYAMCLALRQLSNQIKDAKLALISMGYNPNIVVIPDYDRFQFALFRQPPWSYRSSRKNGCADWEGMHVIKWPYTDPNSILVADIHSFFGMVGRTEPAPEFRIKDPSEAERTQFRETILHVNELEELPKNNELRAIATGTLAPAIGIADQKAALRINLGKCNGMYAKLDDTYHRPWCAAIADVQNTTYTLFYPRSSNAPKPCPLCNPETWDLEAMRGNDSCLGPD